MTDDSSHRLLQMIDTFRTLGIDVHVLTARWHSSWPERATLRGAHVTRLLPPPRTNWNEGHFQRQVLTWLGQNSESYDAIYVDRSDGLASAIGAKGTKWRKPVLVRFAIDNDTRGIAKGQMFGLAAAADACRRCDRVIAPNAAAHRILISEGIDPERIHRIPDWAVGNVDRTREARSAAAAALFQVSSDFVIPRQTDLIIHYGFTETRELMIVASALCDFLDRGASVRMWIVGCGSSQEEVLDAVRDRGWHREILLFDGFDDLEEIASVADLGIVSNPAIASQYSALFFADAGIPLLVAGETTPHDTAPYATASYSDRDKLLARLQEWQIHRQQWSEQAIRRSRSSTVQQQATQSARLWEEVLRPSSIGTHR